MISCFACNAKQMALLTAVCPIGFTSNVSQAEARRYSRQLILDEFGVNGLRHLRSSAVLVVGAGGLGTSACLHLAANGVGIIGIVDYDVIEESNLPRQITYRLADVGRKKVDVLAEICRQQNPNNITVLAYDKHFTTSSAKDILCDARIINSSKRSWDAVLDCVDNAPTRYLLNDLCSVAGIPLVSGAALKWEGQLTTFMFNGDSPCRRCWWPVFSDEENEDDSRHCAGACSELGVFGPVPGLIGTLQAVEALKTCSGMQACFGNGRLLVYDATDDNCAFRIIRMPTKKSDSCRVCALRCDFADRTDAAAAFEKALQLRALPVISSEADMNNMQHSNTHIGGSSLTSTIKIPRLSPQKVVEIALESANASDFTQTVSSTAINNVSGSLSYCAIVDVRPENEINICSLPCSVNLPFQDLLYSKDKCRRRFWDFLDTLVAKEYALGAGDAQRISPNAAKPEHVNLVLLCRRGNDSQLAYATLVDFAESYRNDALDRRFNIDIVGDMIGGLEAWTDQIDNSFPMY